MISHSVVSIDFCERHRMHFLLNLISVAFGWFRANSLIALLRGQCAGSYVRTVNISTPPNWYRPSVTETSYCSITTAFQIGDWRLVRCIIQCYDAAKPNISD